MKSPQIQVLESEREVMLKLSSTIEEIAKNSISKSGSFKVGVSGGSLAKLLVQGLPNIDTDFSKWTIFFCDERVVSETDSDSTFGVYKELIGKVGLSESQFVKIKQGMSAENVALDYSRQIAAHFPDTLAPPEFDLLLLGIGPDGHTCSLFPGHKLLEEKSVWIAPIIDSPKPPPGRITMTYPVINAARNCIFAISGEGKADAIKRILVDKEDLPATRVKPKGSLIWIMDKSAAKIMKDL